MCKRGGSPKVKSPINYVEYKVFEQMFSNFLTDK